MKILVLSDLHLAHLAFSALHEGRRIDEEADVVVLAGDIDDGVCGFRWARETAFAYPHHKLLSHLCDAAKQGTVEDYIARRRGLKGEGLM